MYKKFSDIFELVLDSDTTHSPQYTACATVLLYEALHACKFIIEEVNYTAFKTCSRYSDYYVPNDYFQLSSGIGHCSRLSYWFIGVYNLDPNSSLYKLLDACRCITDPEEVKKRIQKCCYNNYKASQKQSNLPKSIRI